jgi:hypothetical protein
MRWSLPVIWGGDQPRWLRPIGTTGKSDARAKMLSSDEQLLALLPFLRSRATTFYFVMAGLDPAIHVF